MNDYDILYKEYKERIAKNLKDIRMEKKITQEKLSELIDVGPQTISNIERGAAFPQAETIVRICSCLEIDIIDLLVPIRVDKEDLEGLRQIVLQMSDGQLKSLQKALYNIKSYLK